MGTKQVLIVHSPYRIPGGEERHVEQLVSLYEAGGWKVTRIPSAEKPDWWNGRWDRVHAHRLFPGYGVRFLKWLEILEGKTQRILTLHNRRIFCTNGLASRKGRECLRCLEKPKWIPLALNCNSDYPKTVYYTWMLNRIRRQELWNRAFDRFIAPSEALLEQAARSGLSREKLFLVPHSVDFPEGSPAPLGDRDGILEFDAVYAGRFSEEKGSRLMLKLVQELPQLRWLFLCSADSPDLPKLQALAPSSAITIRTDSARETIWRSIGRSRIALAPSTVDESFGLFIAEAMAAGKPVLIPEREAMKWWTLSPFLGTPVPEGLPNWVRAIQDALKQPAIPAARIQAVRERLNGRDYLSKIDYET